MTDERIAEIEERAHKVFVRNSWANNVLSGDVAELISEVKRLRAIEAAARAVVDGRCNGSCLRAALAKEPGK